MVWKSVAGILTTIFGAIFVGYCVYFDRIRRDDPDFKRKLLERRRARKCVPNGPAVQLPDLKDSNATKEFFCTQVQLGEQSLYHQDVERAVEHFANALAVSDQPHYMFHEFVKNFPPYAIEMLLQKLPTINENFLKHQTGVFAEQDLE